MMDNFEEYKPKIPRPVRADFETVYYYRDGECIGSPKNRTERSAFEHYLKDRNLGNYVTQKKFRADEWRAAMDVYLEEESSLLRKFKEDALKECGLAGHPKADKAYSLAWEEGHALGYGQVLYELQNLADLLL
jgi:hypothetical protein